MLLVETVLQKSPIGGNGLFAKSFIKKGTVIWDFHPDFDRLFSQEQVDGMDPLLKKFVTKYAYMDDDIHDGLYVLCVDDGRFMNHSNDANTCNGLNNQTIAKRDILPLEEITCDYFEFDSIAQKKLDM